MNKDGLKNFKEISQSEWHRGGTAQKSPPDMDIVMGCLQRIATALESISDHLNSAPKDYHIENLKEEIVDALKDQKHIINVKPAVIKS